MITGPRGTVKLARKLRGEMSLPEGVLWRVLRSRPGGFKFRRQHPAGIYVLDFYCAAVRLAIEVDGFAHEADEVADKDERRAIYLRSQGVATVRVPAKAVLDDVNAVVVRLVQICEERAEKLAARRMVPLHHPADGPPPRSGEEL